MWCHLNVSINITPQVILYHPIFCWLLFTKSHLCLTRFSEPKIILITYKYSCFLSGTILRVWSIEDPNISNLKIAYLASYESKYALLGWEPHFEHKKLHRCCAYPRKTAKNPVVACSCIKRRQLPDWKTRRLNKRLTFGPSQTQTKFLERLTQGAVVYFTMNRLIVAIGQIFYAFSLCPSCISQENNYHIQSFWVPVLHWQIWF